MGTLSIVRYFKNTPFRKLDLLPSLGGRHLTLFGPLERADHSDWS
jgi:hypothetical protein